MRKTTKKEQVLRTISRWNGISCEEIEYRTGMRHQTVSARLKDLRDEKKIRIVGRAKTTSGRTARLYSTALVVTK